MKEEEKLIVRTSLEMRYLRHKCVWVEPSQLLRAVDPPDLPPVLAVVVHEHVLADAQQGGGVHLEGRGHCHLEA